MMSYVARIMNPKIDVSLRLLKPMMEMKGMEL